MSASLGLFVQQQVAWNNRVFLTAALRGDDNSTFGGENTFSAAWGWQVADAVRASMSIPFFFRPVQFLVFDPLTVVVNWPGLVPR